MNKIIYQGLSIKTLQLNLMDMKNAFKLLENILFIIS